MRLIDADGVKNSLLTELLMGVDGGTDASYLKTYEVIDRIENIVNEWVDNQITVKAIPIEWLEQMIEEDKCNAHIDEYGEYQEGTTLGESCEHVLSNWYNTYKWKWEKENGNID